MLTNSKLVDVFSDQNMIILTDKQQSLLVFARFQLLSGILLEKTHHNINILFLQCPGRKLSCRLWSVLSRLSNVCFCAYSVFLPEFLYCDDAGHVAVTKYKEYIL
jgi:hypothetical protein